MLLCHDWPKQTCDYNLHGYSTDCYKLMTYDSAQYKQSNNNKKNQQSDPLLDRELCNK